MLSPAPWLRLPVRHSSAASAVRHTLSLSSASPFPPVNVCDSPLSLSLSISHCPRQPLMRHRLIPLWLCLIVPCSSGVVADPDSQRTPLAECVVVGFPIGNLELLLWHDSLRAVREDRDLILISAQSSIYSTKPQITDRKSI